MRRYRIVGGLADAIIGKGDRAVEDGFDGGNDEAERHVGNGCAFRTAEMGEKDDLGAFVGQFEDCRRNALDAGHIGDLAICHGNVQVNAHENALSGNLEEIVEGLECRHGDRSSGWCIGGNSTRPLHRRGPDASRPRTLFGGGRMAPISGKAGGPRRALHWQSQGPGWPVPGGLAARAAWRMSRPYPHRQACRATSCAPRRAG